MPLRHGKDRKYLILVLTSHCKFIGWRHFRLSDYSTTEFLMDQGIIQSKFSTTRKFMEAGSWLRLQTGHNRIVCSWVSTI